MTMPNLNDFVKKIFFKNGTMNESQLQKIYKNPIYPRDSKIHSDKLFVIVDNGSVCGYYWTCFIVKDNKSYYYDSFGGQPD